LKILWAGAELDYKTRAKLKKRQTPAGDKPKVCDDGNDDDEMMTRMVVIMLVLLL